MISVIRPDMAAKVIEPPKAETQDDKDLGAKWVKFFIIFGGMLAASAAFFAHQVITGGRFLGTSAMLMASAFAMLLYVTAKYISVKVLLPKKFNKAVDKYGRDNLIAQLSETSTLGFFIVEDFYDNLLILTKDYVLSANEFVIALSEIREMVVSKVDIYEEGVKKMHDERGQNHDQNRDLQSAHGLLFSHDLPAVPFLFFMIINFLLTHCSTPSFTL